MEHQSVNNGANGGTQSVPSGMGPGAGSVVRPRPPVPKPAPPPPASSGSIGSAAAGAGAASQAAVARRKLTRPPRLESVSESEHSDRSLVDSPASSDSFGVKSYLHKFYEEDPAFKDRDDIYCCDDEEHPLADLAARKRRRLCGCSPVWWKAGAWVGLNILILAILALIVGYFIIPRKEVLGYNEDIPVVDEEARQFNRKLDSAKLAGLIMMCVGGLVIAASLLVPSFSFATDDDSSYREEIRVDAENTFPPYMPVASQQEAAEDGIPYTSALTNVQPERAKGEAVVAGKGVVSVQQ